ncbi:MAG: iron ABC transporter permease [Bacteroidota bacterium]
MQEITLASPLEQKLTTTIKGKSLRSYFFFGLLIVTTIAAFLLELGIGSVTIPVRDILTALFNSSAAKPMQVTIIHELRLPRALVAGIGGAALGVAGLQLQTLFRNPLAAPWTLGLTAGSQLGVALVVVTASVVGSSFLANLSFLSNLGVVLGAILGCGAVLFMMIAISRYVSTITLLIFGLMLGFFAQGMISVVLHFTNQSQAKVFAGWNDGSFAAVYWEHFPVLMPLVLLGLISAWLMAKPLNALLLGENYAQSLGLNIKNLRIAALVSSVFLAAPVTAYCGPILFLGLIIPHLARGLFGTSNHRILIPAAILLGATLAQLADLFVHLPWERHFLHLNAVNAVVGAPVVMWVILKSRKMRTFEA